MKGKICISLIFFRFNHLNYFRFKNKNNLENKINLLSQDE